MLKKQPWNESDATSTIREIATSNEFDLWITEHALERMHERSLIMGDLMYVVKNGFVRKPCKPSTQDGFFKYKLESCTPNSATRKVGVVVVPDHAKMGLKIVTVMWVDETATVSGSIIGEKV